MQERELSDEPPKIVERDEYTGEVRYKGMNWAQSEQYREGKENSV